MKYADLRLYIERYRKGQIARHMLMCAFEMWTRAGSMTGCPHIDSRAESVMIAQGGLSC